MYDDLVRRAATLRQAGLVVALLSGVGLGLAVAIAWRLADGGLGEVSLAVIVLAALVLGATAFGLLQARSVANLLEHHRMSQAGIIGDLERRIVALESELVRRDDDAARRDEADRREAERREAAERLAAEDRP